MVDFSRFTRSQRSTLEALSFGAYSVTVLEILDAGAFSVVVDSVAQDGTQTLITRKYAIGPRGKREMLETTFGQAKDKASAR